MARTPQPFRFDTTIDDDRSHHLHLQLSGDLDGKPEDEETFDLLVKAVTDGIRTAVIVHSRHIRLVPEGAERWMKFIRDVPASIQFIYCASQLSSVMRDDDYVRRHPRHVHVTLDYLDLD